MGTSVFLLFMYVKNLTREKTGHTEAEAVCLCRCVSFQALSASLSDFRSRTSGIKTRTAPSCEGLLTHPLRGLVLLVQKVTPGLGRVDSLVVKKFPPWL